MDSKQLSQPIESTEEKTIVTDDSIEEITDIEAENLAVEVAAVDETNYKLSNEEKTEFITTRKRISNLSTIPIQLLCNNLYNSVTSHPDFQLINEPLKYLNNRGSYLYWITSDYKAKEVLKQ